MKLNDTIMNVKTLEMKLDDKVVIISGDDEKFNEKFKPYIESKIRLIIVNFENDKVKLMINRKGLINFLIPKVNIEVVK